MDDKVKLMDEKLNQTAALLRRISAEHGPQLIPPGVNADTPVYTTTIWPKDTLDGILNPKSPPPEKKGPAI